MNAPTPWPETIDLSLTNFCNLQCVFCHSTAYDFGKPQSIPIELIYKLEPAFKHAKSVTLFNRFEPLVHPRFVEIFAFISQFPCSLYFSTNGLNLTEELSSRLIKGKLDYLTISISSLCADQYSKLYGKNVLPLVLKNLRTIVRLKKASNSSLPRIRIMVVLMKSNLDQLIPIIDLASELNLEEGVAINYFLSHRESLLSENPLSSENHGAVKLCLSKSKAYAQKKGVKLEVQAGASEELTEEQQSFIQETGHKFCMEPFRRVSIEHNGDVKACSVANEVLGNLHETAIDKIWWNNTFNSFRTSVNTADPPQSCRNCWHCRQGAFQIENGEYSVHGQNVMGVPKRDEKKGRE